MTRRPVTVKPADTLGDVVKVLSMKRISGCPVVRNGRLVGVVTQTDVVRAMDVYGKINKSTMQLVLAAIRPEKKPQLDRLLRTKVKSFMQGGAVFIGEEDDIYRAASAMSRHKIDRLPVVRKGRLVGILTKKDIVKFLGKLEQA